jgi:large subunit ribosomal protein L3
MKAKAIKGPMSQIWKDGKVRPITTLRVVEESEEFLKEAKEGDKVTIIGKSKGKGFQGVVKRHGFHGAPASHGTKHNLRAPGSIGATGPQRVMPGTKMAGRMGNQKMTLKKRIIEHVDVSEGTVAIRGPVPGMRKSKVQICK